MKSPDKIKFNNFDEAVNAYFGLLKTFEKLRAERKPTEQFLNDMKEHFEQNSTLERDDWNRLHGRILAFNPESDFSKFRL